MWTIRCVNAADQENPILVDGVFKTINKTCIILQSTDLSHLNLS